ncbi:hypothetical protein BHF71_07165 [Vulcanibacillus modesticaldus]|uniref:DUF2007 domain-containing protein n=1 Tax=Vulcanibacillus modesticaldus TaxID=337097 RepID=A0A1D2YW95_9BACI|nr:hypothetical protein [Vulcanibacillus modesticaldus]OEF99968.1 hypothetical protein BHF71_07165 [Vulcanibacillus modesticaldus]
MDNYIKVTAIENEIEAQIVEDILTVNKIPYYIRSFHDEAYGSLFQVQKGFGDLYAPEAYKEQIEEIIDEIRKSVK